MLLQSLSAQLRSRELSLADAESQLAAKDEALAAAGQETANMHKVGLLAFLRPVVGRAVVMHAAVCACTNDIMWKVSSSQALVQGWQYPLKPHPPIKLSRKQHSLLLTHTSVCCPCLVLFRPWQLWTVSVTSCQRSWTQPGMSTACWRKGLTAHAGWLMMCHGKATVHVPTWWWWGGGTLHDIITKHIPAGSAACERGGGAAALGVAGRMQLMGVRMGGGVGEGIEQAGVMVLSEAVIDIVRC